MRPKNGGENREKPPITLQVTALLQRSNCLTWECVCGYMYTRMRASFAVSKNAVKNLFLFLFLF